MTILDFPPLVKKSWLRSPLKKYFIPNEFKIKTHLPIEEEGIKNSGFISFNYFSIFFLFRIFHFHGILNNLSSSPCSALSPFSTLLLYSSPFSNLQDFFSFFILFYSIFILISLEPRLNLLHFWKWGEFKFETPGKFPKSRNNTDDNSWCYSHVESWRCKIEFSIYPPTAR